MREKQRRAELKAQGIDPDAEDQQPKKTYDDSFLKKYDYGNEDEGEEETKQEEESKEETKEEVKPAGQGKNSKK